MAVIALFAIISIPYYGSSFSSGLDPSWNLALNYIAFSEYKFGTDVIFTHGPLGFICSALAINSNLLVAQILWLIFYGVQIGLITRLIRKNNTSKKILFAFLSMYMVGLPRAGDYLCCILMLCLVLAWDGDKVAGIASGIITSFVFFVKFSSAIFAITTIIAFIAMSYFQENRKAYLKGFIIIPFGIVFGYLFYHPSISGLISYLIGSIEMTSGYTVAMSYTRNDMYVYWVILIVVLYLLIAGLLFKGNKNLGLVMVWFAPGLFLLYKHGFVRADGHTSQAFCGIFWMLSVLVLCLKDGEDVGGGGNQKAVLACSSVMIAVAYLCSASSPDTVYYKLKGYIADIPINSMLVSDSRKTLPHLGPKMREIIDDDTVTVYPWEVSYVAADRLNYAPMPVLQAYSAYTPYLDEVNAMFFQGMDAPRYIIMNCDTIDKRLPFVEAPETWNQIMFNYSAVFYDEANGLVLLEKTKAYVGQKQTYTMAAYDSNATITFDGADYMTIRFKHNLRGRLAKLFWKIPEVDMRVVYADGTVKEGRIIPENLSGDVCIRSLPYDNETLIDAVNDDGVKSMIKEISFSGEGLRYYHGKIDVGVSGLR